ncbi:MAG: T9SS type A sorting domain-containing protein [Ignavibacteria bacterium]|nr:T9SS type A sorting domain-containing protein [Ignavibacteria bacterium]
MFKHITLLLFITALLAFDGWAATYYSQGSVAPNTLANWKSTRDGSGSPTTPGSFTAGDIFVIQNGHSMTTSGTWSISGTNSKLWIENGGILTIVHTVTLATATTFQMDNGSSCVVNVALALATTLFQGTESFSSNSTIEIKVNPSGTTAPGGSGYGNLIINVASGSNFGWGGTLTTVQGNLTIKATGGGAIRHALVASAANKSVTVGGNLVVEGGAFYFSSGSSTVDMTVTGNVLISGGTLDLANSTGAGTLNISGNLTISGGTLLANSTVSTINFNGVSSQFTFSSGTLTNTRINWAVNTSKSLTLNNSLPVATSRSLTVNGTLDCGTDTVIGAGSFTLASGATLKIGSPDGISNAVSTGNIQVSGTRTYNFGGIYEYNGGSAQVTGPSLPATISGTLKINNSFGVTATNGVTVSGILDLSSGFFNLNDKSFTFSGTVTGSGTLSGTSLTDVTISGTGAFGTLNFSSGSRVLGALTLNRTSSGTVTLGSDLLIDVGDLTLTSGHLSLGANTLTIASGSDILTPSSSSFIVTNGAGSLKWTIPDATSKIFPVGFSSANYNPVTLTNPTSKEFSVRAKSGTSNPVVSTAHLPVFWDITPTGVDNLNATVKLQWNGSQESGQVGFDRASNLELARWTGAPLGWVTKTATLTGADPYTAEATGFSAFSEFGVSTNGALPVELTSFTASAKGTSVTLNWETKTEVDNNGFEVERNTNGNWDKIGFVEGHGTANSPKYYSFVDNGAIGNKIQYRLKQIDNDGTFEYSPEVEVELNPTTFALYQNYPNPFNPSTMIRFSMPVNGNVALNVFNTLGEKVATLLNGQLEAGYHEVSFDAQNLPSGLYFYEIKAGDFSSIKKMILIK